MSFRKVRSRWVGKLLAALLAAVAAVAGPNPAHAASRRAFAVAAQPLPRALLEFAVQANISIAIGQADQCRRTSEGVKGVLTIDEALDRLLAGTGCGFQAIDASTVKIVRRPAVIRAAGPPEARATRTLAAAPSSQTALGEVVVTATRRSALATRLPDTIDVIDGESLDVDRDLDIATLSGLVPGLIVTNRGPGRDKSILRGLSDGGLTGRTQATVGVYLDDTRLTYNAPDPDLPLIDVDQVELLQGPQGALYGAGSIGGIIHVITRRPDLDRFGGMITVEGAATSHGAPSALVAGSLNAPIVPGALGLRAVFYDEHDGGYVSDVNLGRKDANHTDRAGGRLALMLDINPDWTLEVGAVSQTLSSADSQYALSALGDFNRTLNVTEPHATQFNAVHVTLGGLLPAGRFKNTLSLVRHDIDTQYDATSTLAQFDPFASGAAAYTEADRIDTLIDEATLTSVGASRFQWLVGAFVSTGRQYLKSDINTRASGSPANTLIYDEHRADSINELALYGEASFDITPRLAVEAGARLGVTDVHTASMAREPWAAAGGTAAFRRGLTDLHIEPKLSLRYRLTDTTLVYALASEGARGGGYNTGKPIGSIFVSPNDRLEPFRRFSGDEIWNFEAGVKTRLFSDHLSLSAVAFYDLWRNIQSDQILPSGIVYTANIGDGRNFGVEFEAAYQVGDFDLSVSTMLDEPELFRRTTTFPSLAHSGLPGAPRATVGAALSYQRKGAGPQPFFNASIEYVGLSRLDFDERISRRMGNYATSRLVGGLRAETWRVAAFIDNPLGQAGDTFGFGNPFTVLHARQVTPLRPLTGGLQVTRTF